MTRFAPMATLMLVGFAVGYNGDVAELRCPAECECRYSRVNWATDCSESNLTRVPHADIDPSVYVLDLAGNRIEDVEPFPPDVRLRRLLLADNRLTAVRRDAFAELQHVIDADFAGNRIRRVDPFAFENKAGFLTLELRDNPLDPVDGVFLYSKTLHHLDIGNCNLTRLGASFFANLTALHALDLSDNPLEALDDAALRPLRSLGTLKLNRCRLRFIAADAFAALGNLGTLELAGNRFAGVRWAAVLRPLVRLEYVDLRRSGLTAADVPPDAFDGTAYLRTLILADNELGGAAGDWDVAAAVGARLANLELLDLSRCHLRRALSEHAFANASKLRTLYLSGNALATSDLLLALAPLARLQKLTLSHSGLRQLPDTLRTFASLVELDISHNPLDDVFVELLAPLRALEYLNMAHSNLSHVAPDTFAKMTSLKRLVLSGNELHSLEAGLFANLAHLESLELNACGLRRPLNATVFFSNLTYTDLTELQLAGNPLRVAPRGPLLPKQLSRLEALDLSDCNLTFLPADAFRHTTHIARLILAGNSFAAMSDLGFLAALPLLSSLDLRHNRLTSLAPRDVDANARLEKLQLIGNPWRCGCWLPTFWNWVVDGKGNLQMLEGAIPEDDDIAVGKTKRKRLLVCHGETSTNESRVATWAKYVRTSGCEPRPVQEQSPERTKRQANIEADANLEEKLELKAHHSANSWGHNLVYVTVFYCVALAGVYLLYIIFKRPNKPGNTKIH